MHCHDCGREIPDDEEYWVIELNIEAGKRLKDGSRSIDVLDSQRCLGYASSALMRTI
jgi:hypothetical protein